MLRRSSTHIWGTQLPVAAECLEQKGAWDARLADPNPYSELAERVDTQMRDNGHYHFSPRERRLLNRSLGFVLENRDLLVPIRTSGLLAEKGISTFDAAEHPVDLSQAQSQSTHEYDQLGIGATILRDNL